MTRGKAVEMLKRAYELASHLHHAWAWREWEDIQAAIKGCRTPNSMAAAILRTAPADERYRGIDAPVWSSRLGCFVHVTGTRRSEYRVYPDRTVQIVHRKPLPGEPAEGPVCLTKEIWVDGSIVVTQCGRALLRHLEAIGVIEFDWRIDWWKVRPPARGWTYQHVVWDGSVEPYTLEGIIADAVSREVEGAKEAKHQWSDGFRAIELGADAAVSAILEHCQA